MAPKPPPPPASALDRLSTTGKVALGGVFVALIAALYFVVFYGDVAAQISTAKMAAGTLETNLSQMKASKDAYLKDVETKTKGEARAREQKKMLPDEPETPAFLSQLQGQATIAGVSLTSWNPMDETVQEFYVKVPLKLTLSGKFHQVMRFFHLVGQMERITNIEDVKIKTPKAQTEEVTVEVECLATAFRAVKPGETPNTNKRRGGK
jgi:type IV pilus assembly protein PilO